VTPKIQQTNSTLWKDEVQTGKDLTSPGGYLDSDGLSLERLHEMERLGTGDEEYRYMHQGSRSSSHKQPAFMALRNDK
jgi:hypothetical protein